MGRDGHRYLAWMEVAAQGMIAYTDDLLGTAWTTVNIGGGAGNQGSVWGQAVFSLHGRFIFLAGNLGNIWKSTDYGLTWTNVDAAAFATDYYCIHFADEYYGMAGGDAGIVTVTSDGGTTWTAATVVNAAEIKCCWRLDKNRMWVGTDDGELFFSRDGGTTWTERTGWVGAGDGGEVQSMSWYGDHYGFMVHDVPGGVGTVFRTINGGYNWEAITTPTNAGLNHIAAVSPSLAYAAGEASGGTNVYLKIREGA